MSLTAATEFLSSLSELEFDRLYRGAWYRHYAALAGGTRFGVNRLRPRP